MAEAKPATPPSAQPETWWQGWVKCMTPTPQDALFRVLLADSGCAQAPLRDHLPDTPPKIVEGGLVDAAPRGSRSGLTMEVGTKTGHPVFVPVPVEHEGIPDPGAAPQVASCMIRIWQRHAQGRVARLRALPPIVPLVFHSGPSRWTVQEGLAETIASDDLALVLLPGQQAEGFRGGAVFSPMGDRPGTGSEMPWGSWGADILRRSDTARDFGPWSGRWGVERSFPPPARHDRGAWTLRGHRAVTIAAQRVI